MLASVRTSGGVSGVNNKNFLYLMADSATRKGSSDISWTGTTQAQFDSLYNRIIQLFSTCYVIKDGDYDYTITRIPNSKMNYTAFSYEMRYNVLLVNRFTDLLAMTNYVSTTTDIISSYNTQYNGETLASLVGGTTKVIAYMNASRWNVEPIYNRGDTTKPYFEWSEEYRV